MNGSGTRRSRHVSDVPDKISHSILNVTAWVKLPFKELCLEQMSDRLKHACCHRTEWGLSVALAATPCMDCLYGIQCCAIFAEIN